MICIWQSNRIIFTKQIFYCFIEYLNLLNNKSFDARKSRRHLPALKKYFTYLYQQGVRNDYPCNSLQIIKFKSNLIDFAELYTTAELDEIKQLAQQTTKREQLVLLFFLEFAITNSELSALRWSDVDLYNGILSIKKSRTLNARKLGIPAFLLHLLIEHFNEVNPSHEEHLFLTKEKTPMNNDSISYIFSKCNYIKEGKRFCAKTLRQSRIYHWINEQRLPVETVQDMAGHKWISSTIRYRFGNLTELVETMNQFFPLR